MNNIITKPQLMKNLFNKCIYTFINTDFIGENSENIINNFDPYEFFINIYLKNSPKFVTDNFSISCIDLKQEDNKINYKSIIINFYIRTENAIQEIIKIWKETDICLNINYEVLQSPFDNIYQCIIEFVRYYVSEYDGQIIKIVITNNTIQKIIESFKNLNNIFDYYEKYLV